MMDVDVAAQAVIDLLAPLSLETTRPIPRRVDIRIRAEDLVKAVRMLQDSGWGYLVAITGMDHPAPLSPEGLPQGEGSLEVLYSFGHGPVCLFLRITLPYSDARVQTVCDLIPSATLYERELREMFGVDVIGTPDRRRLIVADDFPEGVYPMRKSFSGKRSSSNEEEGATE